MIYFIAMVLVNSLALLVILSPFYILYSLVKEGIRRVLYHGFKLRVYTLDEMAERGFIQPVKKGVVYAEARVLTPEEVQALKEKEYRETRACLDLLYREPVKRKIKF